MYSCLSSSLNSNIFVLWLYVKFCKIFQNQSIVQRYKFSSCWMKTLNLCEIDAFSKFLAFTFQNWAGKSTNVNMGRQNAHARQSDSYVWFPYAYVWLTDAAAWWKSDTALRRTDASAWRQWHARTECVGPCQCKHTIKVRWNYRDPCLPTFHSWN